MSESDTPLYPEPNIVVGLGRFGLSVLERLGADWRWLSDAAGDDPSLKNLRLLSVRADEDAHPDDWLEDDTALACVARAAGDDDLPTLALHFAILRSLGLIRFRNGTYQFALPRDAGVVETQSHQTTRRRRFFDWLTLDSDPIRAVNALHRRAAENPEVDLFITPIVERVAHGQSPRLLIHLIARCRALLQGRDPSPWPWLNHLLPESDGAPDEPIQLPADPDWLTDDDRAGYLDGLVPPPLKPPPKNHENDRTQGATSSPFSGLSVDLPPVFVHRPGDLPTPLNPQRLLRVDWETSGWAAGELDDRESIEFHPVESSPFRLGFFDHDRRPPADDSALAERLESLGQRVHQGLMRLWLDLQYEREEVAFDEMASRHRAGADDAVEQCLELLSELIIQPLLDDEDYRFPTERPNERSDRWVDGPTLPERPTGALSATIVDRESDATRPDRPLLERLLELGLPVEELDFGERPLFRDLTLDPAQLADDDLGELRRVINDETRHLISFDHLKRSRQQPTRRPPRLTIYVVGDVKDPFVRRAFRPLLRALHQELMRAYAPIFNTSRDGFDRPLSIVPIVWSPHPADAFGGDQARANLIEEASILDSVHGLRRWVEALPSNRRCIPQIFLNSRVTDSSVLGVDEASRQTRDFLSLQMRNALASDSWLRETAVGYTSDDLFSTFSCVEIDFPAERAREYLATRLGREALGRLQQSGGGANQDLSDSDLPALDRDDADLMADPQRRLKQVTASTADRLTSKVDDRVVLDDATTTRELLDSFDEAFEDRLYEQVHEAWQKLQRRSGAMDDMIDDLRREASRELDDTIEAARKGADRLIETHAAEGGLQTARAGLRELRRNSQQALDAAEDQRRQAIRRCQQHDLPDSSPIASSRQQLLQASEDKPDRTPLIIGLLLWAAMAPTLGAPIVHAIAQGLNLPQNPNPLEWILGPLGFITGAVLLFLPAFFLLRRHLKRATNRVQDAITNLASTVRDVVEGGRGDLFSASPSIRSFFSARLRLTHALSHRQFSDRLHDRVTCDNQLAFRLSRSVEIQARKLRRRAEILGARPRRGEGDDQRLSDDIANIFGAPGVYDRLLTPERLLDYYDLHFQTLRDVDNALPEIIEQARGFERWRREACLSDTDLLLGYGREQFLDLVTTPVGARPSFEVDVGRHLTHFVARHYANIGFGARFVGYEGFDANGLRRLADTALVLHPLLRPTFDKAADDPEADRISETMDIIEANILPNTAYMLSLVQGIHARSIDNFQRHEGFFDRMELPDPAVPWHSQPLTLAGRHRDDPPPNSDAGPDPDPEPDPGPDPEPQSPDEREEIS